MISYEEFEDIVVNILKRDISSNKNQKNAITNRFIMHIDKCRTS